MAILLEGSSLRDVTALREFHEKEVVSIHVNTPLDRAAYILGRTRTWALPVYNDEGLSLGFVDMLDIAAFIISSAPDPSQLTASELDSLTIAGRNISQTPVKDIINRSRRDPFVLFWENGNALEVTQLLAKGVHRVATFKDGPHSPSDPKKEIVGICSQSDVNRFLVGRIQTRPGDLALQEMAETAIRNFPGAITSIAQCKAGVQLLDAETGPSVLSVSPKVTMLYALDKLVHTGLNAIALVNPDTGRLEGTLSATDLRAVFQEEKGSRAFSLFLQPVGEFLAKHHPPSLSPLTATIDRPIGEIMQMLAERRVHRVWTVDEMEKPIGVVSLTNVLSVVVNHKRIASAR